jgi:hypothetical protein
MPQFICFWVGQLVLTAIDRHELAGATRFQFLKFENAGANFRLFELQ